MQDLAASSFLAYTSKQWNPPTPQAAAAPAQYMLKLSSTMNSFALALAGCVSLGLAAHRLRWGDDHGHYHPDVSAASSVDKRNMFQRQKKRRRERSEAAAAVQETAQTDQVADAAPQIQSTV